MLVLLLFVLPCLGRPPQPCANRCHQELQQAGTCTGVARGLASRGVGWPPSGSPQRSRVSRARARGKERRRSSRGFERAVAVMGRGCRAGESRRTWGHVAVPRRE